MNPFVTANGKPIAAQLPCSIEEFLVVQQLPPPKRFSADGTATGSAGETPAQLFSRAA
jgi:hypothetical protein